MKIHMVGGTLSQEISNESIIKHLFALSNMEQIHFDMRSLVKNKEENEMFMIEEHEDNWRSDLYYVKIVPDIYRTKYFGQSHFNFFVKK